MRIMIMVMIMMIIILIMIIVSKRLAPFLCLGDLPLVGRLPRFAFCTFFLFPIFAFFHCFAFHNFLHPSVTPPWAENPDTEGLQVECNDDNDDQYAAIMTPMITMVSRIPITTILINIIIIVCYQCYQCHHHHYHCHMCHQSHIRQSLLEGQESPSLGGNCLHRFLSVSLYFFSFLLCIFCTSECAFADYTIVAVACAMRRFNLHFVFVFFVFV